LMARLTAALGESMKIFPDLNWFSILKTGVFLPP